MGVRALWHLLARNRFAVAPARLPILARAVLHAPFNSVLGRVQVVVHGRRIAAVPTPAPLVVVGHWRSGTTLLHELLARDPRHAAPSTYECFAPGHFLITGRLVRRLRFLLPPLRPMDDMRLGWDSPQEDEFALLVSGVGSLYETIAFPGRRPLGRETLALDGLTARRRREWLRALDGFLRAVTVARTRDGGSAPRLVLKSPTHTARVRALAGAFPDAQFVHIVRDPVEVYCSTLWLWRALWKNHALQPSDTPAAMSLEELVLSNLELLYAGFEEVVAALPPGRITTIRYEDLVADPAGTLRGIYAALGLGEPDLELHWADEIRRIRAWSPRPWRRDPATVARVAERWGALFARHGYGPGDRLGGPRDPA